MKGQRLQVVDTFTYLGSTLSRVVHIDDEVNASIAQASAAFGRLRGSIWDRSGIRLRAGPRRSEDGVGRGGGIDCRRHVSSGVSRYAARGGEHERGFSSYKGVWGPPRIIFKTGLPESAFPCYFQVIFINLAC